MFSIDVKASVKVKAFLALRYRLLYVKSCTGPKDHLLTHSGCGASPSITTWRLPVCVGMFCKVSRRESTTQKPLPLLNPGLLKRELNKPIVRLPCFPSQTFRGARFLGSFFVDCNPCETVARREYSIPSRCAPAIYLLLFYDNCRNSRALIG